MYQPPLTVARQVILPEVGPDGQRLIASRPALLPRDLSAEETDAFRRYVRGAGQSESELAVPQPEGLDALTAGFRHTSSRAIAVGALAALFSIKKALASP